MYKSSTSFVKEPQDVHAFRVYKHKNSQLQPLSIQPTLAQVEKLSGTWHSHWIIISTLITTIQFCPFSATCTMRKPWLAVPPKKNRKGFPQSLVSTKLQRGESASLRNEEVLAMKRRGNKGVQPVHLGRNSQKIWCHLKA